MFTGLRWPLRLDEITWGGTVLVASPLPERYHENDKWVPLSSFSISEPRAD